MSKSGLWLSVPSLVYYTGEGDDALDKGFDRWMEGEQSSSFD